MGRINKKNQLSGTIGKIIFKPIGEKIFVQSHPGKIKQTAATKQSSSEFLHCSSWSKHLRNCIHHFLEDRSDAYMHNRFTSIVYKAIQKNNALPKGERNLLNTDLNDLNGFEFNNNSLLSDFLLITPEIILDNQNQVLISIPEFDPKLALRYPKDIREAELIIYLIATDMTASNPFTEMFFSVPISYSSNTIPAILWTSTIVPADNLVFICAKLLFYKTNPITIKDYINSKEFNPSKLLFVKKSNS